MKKGLEKGMRLPENQNGDHIMDECQAMFDYAMAHGINYFDSAWHYIDSQLVIGQCLEKYPRESYILVGKLCFYDGTLESIEAASAAFEKELHDACTDYMDLELIHALGNPGSLEHPEIEVVQMQENCKILGEDFKPLTDAEQEMLKNVAKLVEDKKPVGCTGCHYCVDKGCPAGINIPEVLPCLNMLNQFNNPRMTRMKYYPAIENCRLYMADSHAGGSRRSCN